MTLSPWVIYLWGIADSIDSMATGIAALASTVSALLFLVYLMIPVIEGNEKAVTLRAMLPMKTVVFLTAVAVLTAALTPSSKTIAVMVVAPAIVNSDPIQKDLPELYKTAKDALMQTLSEKE